ncbi:PAS domain-containing protein [Paraburkholderia strydomiana]|uniref:PAS domain-containing protein n=1 Tax=Paraburkholderia strydomiana TaxID=1245417 RepID=A0ABW9BVY0_9BURK
MNKEFEAVQIEDLLALDGEHLNALPFGAIGFAPDAVVTVYNETEAKNAGLRRERVLGKHFFEEIAPCMNNFMVAQRFDDEDKLDQTIPYVLTLRMRPTPVRLRLLKAPEHATRFVLIERRATN